MGPSMCITWAVAVQVRNRVKGLLEELRCVPDILTPEFADRLLLRCAGRVILPCLCGGWARYTLSTTAAMSTALAYSMTRN